MYILDTNVLIRGLKDTDPDKSFLEKALKKEKVCISFLSIAEYLTKASFEETNRFESILKISNRVGVSEKVCRVAAEYRKNLQKTSRSKLLDNLLAAQAKVHNLTLVTNNASDFPMKDIKIIKPIV